MNSSDSYIPLPGLSIPMVTILDRQGRIIEDEQRSVIRFLIQDGAGASIIFAAGTNGEWDRLDNPRRQQLARIAVEECRAARSRALAIEAWAGITARTAAETLENLEYALELGADAAVVAPLSICDIRSPAEFVIGRIGATFRQRGRSLPLFLYDNADIAAPGKPPHLHTRDVKRMSALDYVRGIKVTADRAVLDNYARAAAHFNQRDEFAIYAGNAYLVLELFDPDARRAGAVRRLWNRYAAPRALPYGVVSGPANAMPREWRGTWEACLARNGALIRRYAALLTAFNDLTVFRRAGGAAYQPMIACLKAALHAMGACESEAVASGTPELAEEERREFKRRFEDLRGRTEQALEPGRNSEYASRPAAARA